MSQIADDGGHHAKSLVREAPDYEARSQYKPRHPSAVVDEPTDLPSKSPALVEPELADDDTRPHPAVEPDVVEVQDEPSFLSHLQPDEVMDTPLPQTNTNVPLEVAQMNSKAENDEVVLARFAIPSSKVGEYPVVDEVDMSEEAATAPDGTP